ncbi:MAG: response regulator [Vicinamibacterales bacterium]
MSVRVLLVEDNEANADMLSRRLIRQGFEVAVAGDGLQALDATARQRPDLILMDISLPRIDGWEATRRLKADPATASIPIVALTAHAMVADRQRCFDAGCDEFETKPVDLKRLLEKMHGLLAAKAQA